MVRSKYQMLAIVFATALILAGCGNGKADLAMQAPPPAQVEHEQDLNVIQVEHPEQFPLATAVEHAAASQLVVTGTVNPDIARTVPVISLASGRIVEVGARLGDTVQKGQLLLRVRSDDVSSAFSDYRKAVSDESLARRQFSRAKDLYAHGAVAEADLEAAQTAEDDAKVTLETAIEHLRLLGNDPEHPTGIVDIYAPVSGVITDQQVTNAAGVQGLSSPNPFTISDLSYVWVLCDVYEKDLRDVHLGETANIRLNAYPDEPLKGTISNIGAILDASVRTAKVRVEVHNPGFLRPGMFVTATFYGVRKEVHAAVPASAVLHLHDSDWVYVPTDGNKFRRMEVVSGETLASQMQEILSGLQPGQKVVANALPLQNTVDNK
jgi:cobalt-zinc-cadmium efflux system membrane fusion protein